MTTRTRSRARSRPATRRRPGARRRPPAPKHRPGRRSGRRLWQAGGWACVLGGTAMLALYLEPRLQAHSLTAMAAAFIPHATLLWVLAGMILALAGNRWGRVWAVVALAGGLLHAQVLVPYTSRFPQPPGPQYTVATLNLRFGEADLNEVAASPAMDAAVLVLTEATPAVETVLDTDPWRSAFPYRAGSTADRAGGTLILARHPMTELARTDDTTFVNVAARVESPLGPIVVVGAHPTYPVRKAAAWAADNAAVLGLAQSESDGLPTVIAGDLNATLEHAPLRDLLAEGFADAASTAGSGWQPSYPANRWYPPLIAIDHVLVDDRLVAAGTRTFSVPGTDHLGLTATLQAA